MWARDVEVMLGCWLLVSPFVFRHPPDRIFLWANDLACGALVILAALISYWAPLRRGHLVVLPLGAWLFLLGWISERGAADQNHLTIALLFALFAIVPTDANRPPLLWRRFARRPRLVGAER